MCHSFIQIPGRSTQPSRSLPSLAISYGNHYRFWAAGPDIILMPLPHNPKYHDGNRLTVRTLTHLHLEFTAVEILKINVSDRIMAYVERGLNHAAAASPRLRRERPHQIRAVKQ